jgi:hypothetical protein
MLDETPKPLVRTPGLPELNEILHRWISVCRDYNAQADGDSCFYHSERAQIGFLSAAAWLSGCVAIEEWYAQKTTGDGTRGRGRGDLWIRLGDFRLHIEAKLTSVDLELDPNQIKNQVESRLEESRLDAQRIVGVQPEEEHVAGVLFVVPKLRLQLLPDARCYFDRWLSSLNKRGHPLA